MSRRPSPVQPSARLRPALRPGTDGALWSMAWWGAGLGSLVALVGFAPATWLAAILLSLSEGQVVLAAPLGTVWNGSARMEFSGGVGSHDAVALPGRISWRLRPTWSGIAAQLNAPCCTPQGMALQLSPRWGGLQLQVNDGNSRWPASLLTGLGTPWNTLQPEGDLHLNSQAFGVTVVQGRVSVSGAAVFEAREMSSRLTTLRPMGSYRVKITGGATGGVTTLLLETLEGSLRLEGQGEWAGSRLRFTGSASAAPDREAALSNLLNIIGRRDGARSIITVG